MNVGVHLSYTHSKDTDDEEHFHSSIHINSQTNLLSLLLPLNVVHEKGPEQQVLPCTGGFVLGEHY